MIKPSFNTASDYLVFKLIYHLSPSQLLPNLLYHSICYVPLVTNRRLATRSGASTSEVMPKVNAALNKSKGVINVG